MNKIYLAPKNEVTEQLAKNCRSFCGYIDKYKQDVDCMTIAQIDLATVDKVIIYSPHYHDEIYREYLKYLPKEKIKFYLFGGLSISSYNAAHTLYKLFLLILAYKKKFKNLFQKSETSKVRKSLETFCKGNGIDIGFGGDPITHSSITIDLPSPYAKYKSNPLHLKGSGDNLYWFKDGVLDYVYSSHLLEDFEDTRKVLNEWLRVLKPNGNLVLFLPNEQSYRKFCAFNGKKPNHNHIHDNFSLNYLKEIINGRDDLKIIHEVEPSFIYSFELVIQKLK